jgi:D-psicose/D-tagatose/L-ribulose 3-epimerase
VDATPAHLSIGASTFLWESPFRPATVGRFEIIAGLGFDFVEVPIEDPALVDLDVLREGLARTGLGLTLCAITGPQRDLTAEDEGPRRACLDYLATCCAMARELGCSFIAGPLYSAVGKARQLPPEARLREWDLAVSGLREACAIAGEHGVRLALEPLNRFESDLVNTAAQARRMVDEIDHPAAAIALDGFHMNIEESDMEQAVRTCGDELVHLQVSESHRGTPGTGTTDWAGLRRGMVAVGYDGPVTLETFTTDNPALAGAVCIWRELAESPEALAADGLAFLRRWIAGEHNPSEN